MVQPSLPNTQSPTIGKKYIPPTEMREPELEPGQKINRTVGPTSDLEETGNQSIQQASSIINEPFKVRIIKNRTNNTIPFIAIAITALAIAIVTFVMLNSETVSTDANKNTPAEEIIE